MYGNNRFLNRELSWLDFNKRVLELSLNKDFSLFERLKFCSIFDSNLDEFFMIRVASLMDQIHADYRGEDISGLSPKDQYKLIEKRVRKLKADQEEILEDLIENHLSKKAIYFLKYSDMSKDQLEYLEDYFNEKIYPVLTPIAIDRSHPFPLISNASLNIIATIAGKEGTRYASVQVPSVLRRLIKLPDEDGTSYIRLEDLIKIFISRLFMGMEVLDSGLYRITRNADLPIDEDEAEDLLMVIEKSVRDRKWGEIIRLEVEENMDKQLLKMLLKSMDISSEKLYKNRLFIDSSFLFELDRNKKLHELEEKSIEPRFIFEGEKGSLFDHIKEKDLFVSHPYDSFDIVSRFIDESSRDESVLAIKQTLYRVGGNSSIIEALKRAAEAGKQVTVLVELMARFDEENNINWARELEKSGCHVIYGNLGLKTHSKISLVVRLEGKHIRRYTHLSTGNYNEDTSKIYSDMAIFTCSESFASDASTFFNRISGYSSLGELKKFYTAPKDLKLKLIKLIEHEIKNALEGKNAYIRAKMNALVDKEIIEKLYEAFDKGVKIELNVRGICCLKPYENSDKKTIRVLSIVGRHLEHSRVFIFANNDNPKVYLSSADWMPRNLDRRVEIMFPIEDEIIKKRIEETLRLYMMDNTSSYILNSSGTYDRVKSRDEGTIDSQKILWDLRHLSDQDFIAELEGLIKKLSSSKNK